MKIFEKPITLRDYLSDIPVGITVYIDSCEAKTSVIRTAANRIRRDKEWIIMDFPKYPIWKMDIPGDFKQSVGFEPIEMYESIDDWKIAIAKNEIDIANTEPNLGLLKRNGLGELMITAKSDSKQADFVVRCFAPDSGIDEDPVTGSAHCALTPLWSEKLGKTELDSLQLSKRTGRLKMKLINDRVEIKGKAITIFEAKLKI
jgi:predicted PhzF superfamily epimerase YddE/YHI9